MQIQDGQKVTDPEQWYLRYTLASLLFILRADIGAFSNLDTVGTRYLYISY
jgi:hypothetical protein